MGPNIVPPPLPSEDNSNQRIYVPVAGRGLKLSDLRNTHPPPICVIRFSGDAAPVWTFVDFEPCVFNGGIEA